MKAGISGDWQQRAIWVAITDSKCGCHVVEEFIIVS
jgi:hypothetical protein